MSPRHKTAALAAIGQLPFALWIHDVYADWRAVHKIGNGPTPAYEIFRDTVQRLCDGIRSMVEEGGNDDFYFDATGCLFLMMNVEHDCVRVRLHVTRHEDIEVPL